MLCHQLYSAEQYQTNWDSLAQHEQAPDWFKDAKFGIYFHWGPYSVPAFGNEHYPRTLYGHPSGKKPVQTEKSKFKPVIGFQTYREHEFHIEKYGEPKHFEYHDLIPLFKAEKFDAEDWAELFYQSGAKFAGPVAEHHDGFAMWDSEQTPWNAADMGPKRDIVGEMSDAIRKRGLKFITTFHHAKNGQPESVKKNWWHFNGRDKYWSRVDKNHQDSKDLQKLYGTMPRAEWLEMWNAKLEEIIDNYKPDLIWFDSWLDKIPEINRQKFAAYYLNSANNWNKDVVITYKQKDLPQSVGVVDFEKGRLDKLTSFSWLTDDTISSGSWTTTGSWSYTDELVIKSSTELVHTLIDIVSKNGQLLLNISPRADGSIPESQRQSLLGLGQWLKQNGEAIYSSRPFLFYGEGPKRLQSSGHFTEMSGAYTAENFRFTRKEDVIYILQMGVEKINEDVLIKTVNKKDFSELEIKSISILGSNKKPEWLLRKDGLLIKAIQSKPNNIAISYKITTNGKF